MWFLEYQEIIVYVKGQITIATSEDTNGMKRKAKSVKNWTLAQTSSARRLVESSKNWISPSFGKNTNASFISVKAVSKTQCFISNKIFIQKIELTRIVWMWGRPRWVWWSRTGNDVDVAIQAVRDTVRRRGAQVKGFSLVVDVTTGGQLTTA